MKDEWLAGRNSTGETGIYWLARDEHALLLRCEGLTYQEIGRRIGLTDHGSVKVKVRYGAEALNRALHRAHFKFI